MHSIGRVHAGICRSHTDEYAIHFEETLAGKLSLEEASLLYEKETITKVLEQCKHNQAEAARRLGITYRALRYKIEQYGIE